MKKITLKIAVLSLIVLSCSEMVDRGLDSIEDPRIPEINIKQGSANIPSGIGSYIIDESKIVDMESDVTFTIENLGNSELELTGSSIIVIEGEYADYFSLIGEPSSNIITPGRSESFTVR